MQARVLPVRTGDGHAAELIARVPDAPRLRLLWLPAMGVAARHYLPFAEALAALGVAVFLHEWRGNGSSNRRASRDCNWGYRELLADIAASDFAAGSAAPGVARVVGGHSLGGQLAACHLALHPHAAQALWLVASGAPWWRTFPQPARAAMRLAFLLLPLAARRVGWLPGRRLRFAGNEARGVIDDWSLSGATGAYAARGVEADLEAGFVRFRGEVAVATCARDWMCPPASAAHLAGKLRNARSRSRRFDDAALGIRADHFAWMRAPGAIAGWLVAPPG